MTDPIITNGSSAAPPTPGSPIPEKVRKRRKTWLRRLRFWLVAVLVAAVIGRLLLWLTLPWIVSLAAGTLDLRCDYERLHLSLLGGSLELWNASVRPEGGDEPFVELEYLAVDVATTALFTGRLVVRRVEIDGLDVSVHRRADGTLSIDRLLNRLRGAAPNADAPPEKHDPAPIDFGLPAQVDAVRAQHVQIRWLDDSLSPPVTARMDVHIRASHLGHPEREARFEAMVVCPGYLDALRVEGRGRGVARTLEARGEVWLRGFKPIGLAPYLKPFGIRPSAEDVDFGVKLEASAGPVVRPASAAKPASGASGDVEVRLRVHEMMARADHHPFFRLDEATVHAGAVTANRALVDRITVKGWEAQAARNEAGRLVVAGFEVLEPERAARPAETQTAAGLAGLARFQVPEDLERFGVRELVVDAGELKLHDRTVTPAADVVLRLVGLTARDVLVNPATRGEMARLKAELASPGNFDRLVLEADAALQGPSKTVQLRGRMTGIALEGLSSMLAPLGLEPVVQRGELEWAVDARLAVGPNDRIDGAFTLRDVRFRNGDGTVYCSLDRAEAQELTQDPARGLLRLGTVTVEGSRLEVVREPDGALVALGLRYRPGTARPVALPSPSAPAAATKGAASPSPAEPLPPLPGSADLGRLRRLEVGRLVVKNHAVQFHDRVPEPAVELALRDMGLTLETLALDMAGSSPDSAAAPEAATLQAWLEVPGVVERLSAKGTLALGVTGGDLALDLEGQGITAARAAPYLRAVGLRPVLQQGSFHGGLTAKVLRKDHAVEATIALTDVRYRDRTTNLASLQAFRVNGFRLAGQELAVQSIQVESPRVQLWRHADGSLAAAGVRLVKAVPLRPAIDDKRVEVGGAPEPGPIASERAAAADPSVRPPASSDLRVSLARFQLTGAEAVLRDETRKPASPITATLQAEVADLVMGPAAPPASFRLAAGVGGALDRLILEGRVSLRSGHESLDLACTAEGIRPDALASGNGTGPGPERSAAADLGARFQARLSAAVTPHEEGGRVVAVDLRDVALDEADPKVPGFQLKSFAVRVPRLDPEGGVIEVESITLAGTRGRVERLADGRWSVGGLTWPPARPGDTAATPTVPAAAPAARPASSEATRGRAALRPLEGLAWRIRRREAWPLIQLKTLDLGLDSLEVVDRTQAGAAPLRVEGLRFRNRKPVVLLGRDPEDNPPVELQLTGRVAPLVEAIQLDVTTSPFASEPQLRWAFQARGIHGADLTRVQPALAARIQGQSLTDGRFTARGSVVVRGRRRHALDFAYPRGWNVEIDVAGVALRNGEQGPVLLGVDEILVEAPRIDPTDGSVHVRTVEILKPRGVIRRDEAGLHVAGVVVKTGTPAAAGAVPEPARAEAPVAPSPAAPPAAPPPAPPSAASAEKPPASNRGVVRVDTFRISGLDFRIEDTSVSPPLRVPLDDLEVEVKGLTTRMLREEIPVLFTVRLGAGRVPLPRHDRASMLGGVLRDTVKAVAGQGTGAGRTEERSLFQEVVSRGEFFLAPKPHGRVTTAASMVELGAFQGVAARAGVTLTNGVFDGTVQVDLEENGNLVTDADLTFTDLSLSEPPGGPISRVLQLPAPLNTVLFVLRDQAGAIHVPLAFTVDAADGLSTGEITGQVVKVLGKLITEAIAASPFRVVGSVTELTSLAGLGGLNRLTGLDRLTGGGEVQDAGPPVELTYTAAATILRHDDRKALDQLAARLKDRRELVVTLSAAVGQEDMACARVRANPSREDCLALLARLRRRTAEILDAREPIVERARAARATGLDEAAARAVADLRALDRELGQIERSLDQLGELLRPGAERYAGRRTRTAALAMARARLVNVEAYLRARVPGLKDRVQLSRPRYDPDTSARRGQVVVRPTIRRTR